MDITGLKWSNRRLSEILSAFIIMEPYQQSTFDKMNAKLTSIERSMKDITNLLEALLEETVVYGELQKQCREQSRRYNLEAPSENQKMKVT